MRRHARSIARVVAAGAEAARRVALELGSAGGLGAGDALAGVVAAAPCRLAVSGSASSDPLGNTTAAVSGRAVSYAVTTGTLASVSPVGATYNACSCTFSSLTEPPKIAPAAAPA